MHNEKEKKVEELRPLLGQEDSKKALYSFAKLMGREVSTPKSKSGFTADEIVQRVYDELDRKAMEAEEKTTGSDLSKTDR